MSRMISRRINMSSGKHGGSVVNNVTRNGYHVSINVPRWAGIQRMIALLVG